MMMNRRLIGAVAESRKYIAGNVAFQWISLAANIVLMAAVALLLQRLYEGAAAARDFARTAAVILCAVAVRFACTVLASRMSYLSARSVKKTLRGQIFRKLLQLVDVLHIRLCIAQKHISRMRFQALVQTLK